MYARTAFGLSLCIAATASSAGTISLPTDISVGLVASPNSNLQPGQQIEFTISVTNHGPESAAPVIMGSSPIHDELDVLSATADCGDTLGVAIVDQNDGYYYEYTWFPTIDLLPLEVGESRYCHLNLELTAAAPEAFSLTFGMPDWLIDLDDSNNSATVTLHRAAQGNAESVPASSTPALAALVVLLSCLALVVRRPSEMGTEDGGERR